MSYSIFFIFKFIVHLFQIVKFGKFLEFSKLKFWKLHVYEIVQIEKLTNIYNFFNLKNKNLAKQIFNFGIIHSFDILHYSKFCKFSYLHFDRNQFSEFRFSIILTRKFGRSTFKRSLIFKFKTSAILKLYCLKF